MNKVLQKSADEELKSQDPHRGAWLFMVWKI